MNQRLPPAWLETTIEELFRTAGGGTPSTSRSEFWGDGVPWITSADIDDAGGISPRKAVTRSGIASSATNPVPPNSVIVVTRVGLGKVGLAKEEVCFSQDCQALLFNPDLLDPSFVAHQTRCMVRGIRGRGTTIAGVTVKQLGALPFSLAPFPEQHRIADAIDSYLTRLDDAVTSLERVQAKLKSYRASVLKAAVEGRLVPTEASLAHAEKRDYEPAEVLLTRILKERCRRWEETELAKRKAAGKPPKDDRWKAKYQEPAAPDTSTLPAVPDGWAWASVDQLTDGARNSAYGVLVPGPDVTDGVPLVRVGDINNGTVSTSALKRIDRKIGDRFARTYLRGGEVLLSLVGTIGRSAIVPDSLSGANVARAVGVVPTSSLVRSRWLELWFRSPRIQALMTSRAHEVARKTLNLEDVRAAAVAVPPAGEQDRIVAEVEDLESVAAAATSNVSADYARCVRLRQAILKWAFEGKLVDQDPTDVPAEELLARIRAERSSAAPSKKRRRDAVKGAA